MQQLLSRHWHHLPTEEIQELLETNPERGLDRFEVEHRQARFGPNALTPRRGKSPLVRFLLQFNNPLIYVLLVAGVITALVKGPVDAGIIIGVVLINAIVGFVQESRAANAIAALAQSMVAEATVIRAGEKKRLPAPELVPGDIVLLQSGDKVPADLRLVQSRDLQIAEAALTGESVPVEKSSAVLLPVDTPLGDRRNMAYATTLVTYGQGIGIVVATGDASEIGRISQLLAEATEMETTLTRKIKEFSRLLLYVLLVVSGLALGISMLRGQPLADAFITSIALAVASIPEGLPTAVTVTLAIGVARMAKRRAIIRKLPAVEALGSTTVIGSDKTGTLTQNQMTVQEIYAGGELFTVEGSGYAPTGRLLRDGVALPTENLPLALQATLETGALANDSQLLQAEGRWTIQGDPTEGALLVVARKAGLDAAALTQRSPRLDVIPFESAHQYMATLHETGAGQSRRALVKGSVEALLARSAQVLAADGQLIPLDKAAIHQQVDRMAAEGLRVLAFAEKRLPADVQNLAHDDIADGLTFLGLQGMMDPPRPEAIVAVRASQEAGIKVKMITGDHPLTAAAIARAVGIAEADQVLTGQQLAALSDDALIAAVEPTGVFARVSPEQKLRLVEALQARGHIVAMTGDGVNDAPALKQANIGVAMGITGTDVSKEAADMVLTDDNFATLEAAVEEGRSVYDNLTKIITWTLPTNVGEGLIILVALLLGEVLPILPVQILWINMVTVAVLGLVLALEPSEPGIMQRPPRDPEAPILTPALLQRILLVGALILIGAFGLFEWERQRGTSLEVARTVAVNLVIFVELFYLLNSRSLTYSPFQIGFFSNRWLWLGVGAMILVQMAFTYVPLMQAIFSSAPLGWSEWWRVLAFGLLSFGIVEIEKWLRARRAG
ncbi:MAG TPA: cation-transporting P-type ATPase [Anaerolineae bacterium]|nr:cation-transporting P-type ATPase [Anaerolineae bacterium]HXK43838.1 cation-transporting P-type ATPase [Anaerolineae bacterium]